MSTSRLLTTELRERLLSNGRLPVSDLPPIVKFFNPAGAGAWLATELASDEDTLFGIADLGFGCPEIGSFSLTELESIKLPFGLRIERDLGFSTEHALSVWAEAARASASLSAAEQILVAARRVQTSRDDP